MGKRDKILIFSQKRQYIREIIAPDKDSKGNKRTGTENN